MRLVTLVDLGAAPLPAQTPPPARFRRWFPVVYTQAQVPPVDGAEVTPVADGVLLEWDAVDSGGAVVTYIIERSATPNGPWEEVARTTETRYLYSDGSGQQWYFRITPSVRGRPGEGVVVEGGSKPLPTVDEMVAVQQQQDQDRADSIARDAAESAQRAADYAQAQVDLLNESALRTAAVKQVADNLSAEVDARVIAVREVADDVVAVAEAVADEEAARIADMLNEKLERQAEITVERTARQTLGESLAQQIGMVAAGSGTQFDSQVIWHFNTSTEGWSGGGGSPTVVDGMLRPANNTSAYAQSPNNLGIDGDAYRFIKTRVRRVGAPPWRGLVRWITNADTAWNDAKSLTIPEPSFDANGLATVDIDLIPWNSGSPVRAVRMALVTNQKEDDYLMYDYVGIGRPSPAASTAMVQDAVLALTNADTAEATQRAALGVQMLGNYTGNDPGAAQGLIGAVNTARIDGDRILGERTNTIELRLPSGSGKLASEAAVTAVEQASITRDDANAQAINRVNATLPAVAAQGSNMVINGGWDLGDNVGWTGMGAASFSYPSEGRTGKCLKVVGAAGGVRSTNVNDGAAVPVTIGKKYRIRAYYKTDAAYNGTTDNGKLRIGNQDGGLITGLGFEANKTGWTVRESIVTATTISGLKVGLTFNHTAGTVWVDDVSIEEVTELLANADATQGLSVSLTNLEGTVAAQSADLTQVRSDVDGKASAVGLQALESKVTQQGNDLTSQAGQMLQLQSGISAAQQAAQDAATTAGAKGKVATDAAAAAAAAQASSSANAGAIASTNTRVAQAEGKIESQGDSITRLDNGLQVLQGAFTAIPNGTFDVDVSNWIASGSGSSFSWDAEEKALRSGPGSLRVANDTPISVNPGDTVTLAFRTKSSEGITGFSSATAGFIGSLGSPTTWAQGWTNWAATTAGEWVKRSYTWEVPSIFNPQNVYVRFAIGTITPSSAYVLIDDVVVQTPGSIGDLQNRVTANAQNLSALTNTVSAQGGNISSLSSTINQLLNDVAGKASTAVLQALEGRVVVAEGKIDTQATALTAVQSQLGAIGGENQLGNSSWDVNTAGWSTGTAGLGGGTVTRSLVDSALPNSTKAWRWNLANVATTGYTECISSNAVKEARVEPGKKATMSVYVRGTPGVRVFLQLRWFNEEGGSISYSSTPNNDAFKTTEAYDRKVYTFTAPATAVRVNAYLRVYGANVADQWVEWDNVQLEAGEVATAYTPSIGGIAADVAANADANSSLNTRTTSLEGTVASQGTAVTNVQADLAATNVALDWAQRSGSNMVVDGSFENRPIGTAIQSWATIVADGRTGSNCLRVGFNSAVRSTTLQTFDLTPDRVYYAEAWVKRAGPAVGSMQLRFNASNNGASATYPNFTTVNLSDISETGWTKVSGYVRLAAGKNRGLLQLNSSATTTFATQLFWDDFVLMDVTEAYNAQQTATGAASAASTLDGKVELINGELAAQGLAVTQVKASAAAADAKAANAQSTADATASGLSATNARVTSAEGQLAAHTTQINQANAAIAGKANASAVIELDAKVSGAITGGGNLLVNTALLDGMKAWDATWAIGGTTQNGYIVNADNLDTGVPVGIRAMAIQAMNTALGEVWRGQTGIPVEAEKTYIFSAHVSGNQAAVQVEYYGPSGNQLWTQASDFMSAAGGRNLKNYARPFVVAKVPTGATEARVWVRSKSGGQYTFTRMLRPMFEEAAPGQEKPSPWSTGGMESFASINLVTDVNGLISGIQNKNDGIVGVINILASVLNIVSPGGIDGFELTQGRLRAWAGNFQAIFGAPFGPDNLFLFLGPNVGVENASKVLATIWFDSNGNAYWGGSLSAGAHKNANRTDSTAPTPYVEVGPFQAYGKQRVVVASFTTRSPQYENLYPGRSPASPPPDPVIGGATTLRLRRNVGSWQIVTQQSFSPGAVVLDNIYHDPDAGWPGLPNGGWQQIYYWACGGSFTATEPGSTFANFMYEAQITVQSIPQIQSQTVGVISTEEP